MYKKYLTIQEVSNLTDTPPHTLRYWEKEFGLLRPQRRESGQRRYTYSDVDIIEKIKYLVYDKKYSISGAKKQLLEEKKQAVGQLELNLTTSSAAIQELKQVKKELYEIKKLLSEEV